MGKPYSLDLRERIVGYVEEGHSARAAAGVFGVSPSTAVRLAAAQRDHGSVAPKPKGRAPGTAGKLTAHIAFLLARMKSEPDTTLQELADVLRERAQGDDPARPPPPVDCPSMPARLDRPIELRSEEHTSELPSLIRISYAAFF